MDNTSDTIPSKEELVMLVGTCVSFNTFTRASQEASEDSNKSKIEI